MEPPADERTARSALDEAISIAILLQQNEQWAAADGHLPQHPRGRARPCRRVALLGRARASAGPQRRGRRADRAEPRARARSRRLAQQPRHRPAGPARARRGDRRLPARDRARSAITPTRTTISASCCGRRAGRSKRKRRTATAIRSIPSTRTPTHNLGVLLNGQKRRTKRPLCFCKVITLRPKHPGSAAAAGAGALHARRGRRGGGASSRSGSAEEPDDPIARHMLAACSGRDVPPRASDAFVETTFDSFAASFDAKLAKLPYRAPALVAEMLAELGRRGVEAPRRARCRMRHRAVRPADRAVRAPAGRRRSVRRDAGAGPGERTSTTSWSRAS